VRGNDPLRLLSQPGVGTELKSKGEGRGKRLLIGTRQPPAPTAASRRGETLAQGTGGARGPSPGSAGRTQPGLGGGRSGRRGALHQTQAESPSRGPSKQSQTHEARFWGFSPPRPRTPRPSRSGVRPVRGASRGAKQGKGGRVSAGRGALRAVAVPRRSGPLGDISRQDPWREAQRRGWICRRPPKAATTSRSNALRPAGSWERTPPRRRGERRRKTPYLWGTLFNDGGQL